MGTTKRSRQVRSSQLRKMSLIRHKPVVVAATLALAATTLVAGMAATQWASATDDTTCALTATLTPVVAINAGGPELTLGGRQWSADRDFVGGSAFVSTNNEQEQVDNDLYQTARKGQSFSYEIPVENGTYLVRVHFAANAAQQQDTQTLNVEGGFVELPKLNVSQQADTRGVLVQGFETAVADGTLSVSVQAVKGLANLAAVEAWRESTQCAPEESESSDTSSPAAPASTPLSPSLGSSPSTPVEPLLPTGSVSPSVQPSTTAAPAVGSGGTAAMRLLGATRSGLPWHSGTWVGGRFNAGMLEQFGNYRGRPVDLVTTYGYGESPDKLINDEWPITTWEGFGGQLNYSLPLAFDNGVTVADVASGAQDATYQDVAADLVKHGRGHSVVRLGWEYNYVGWKWGTTTETVDTFKAAFRRVVTVMRQKAPDLRFEFGISCGDWLKGSSDRLAPLTMGYPGDDVVDIVGCDIYDWWQTRAVGDASASTILRPHSTPGLADVVEFARAHGKGAGFGEWGLSKIAGNNAGGDNPAFIQQMWDFFQKNKDVVVFECYFDETADNMLNSLVAGQMPQSAALYKQLW